MVLYRCDRCNYSTTLLKNFERHQNRKFPCPILTENSSDPPKTLQNPPKSLQKPSDSLQKPSKIHIEQNGPIDNVESDLTCIYCGKEFKRKDNLKRHLDNRCKILKSQMDFIELEKRELDIEKSEFENEKKELENITKELQSKVEKLENDIKNNNLSAVNQINNKNNTKYINSGNINNTQINNITINGFGNESIEHLNDQYFKNLLILPATAVNKLIKDIHCNPHMPENHNLKKTNKKDRYIQYFDGKDWNLEDKKKILDDLVEMTFTILENTADRHGDIDKKYLDRFEQFRDKFYENKEGVKTKNMTEAEILIINNSKK
tara:strand:+ start:190 stop:1149 length:960 start_codon:yes stop_codon:yes gene_type:complete